MPFKVFTYLFLVVFLFACNQSGEIKNQPLTNDRINAVQLAKRFAIVNDKNLKWVYIFGNRNNTASYKNRKTNPNIFIFGGDENYLQLNLKLFAVHKRGIQLRTQLFEIISFYEIPQKDFLRRNS